MISLQFEDNQALTGRRGDAEDWTMTINRRSVVIGGASLATIALMPSVHGKQVIKDISELKPGEFTWHPERAPNGPAAVVVSIPEQRVHVYRNGIRIGVATCSTGKPGHETPTGVFVILQKDKDHRSSTYNNAPMPNMNRLTWSGIALHAGNLPGYPASHGCVRMPMKFSEYLFSITHLGTPVIISGSHADPWELTHPGMVLGAYAEHEFEGVVAGLKGKKHPSDWTEAESSPIHTVIASSADNLIELIENDDVISKSPLGLSGRGALGNHVFMLKATNDGARGLQWMAISHAEGPGANQGATDILRRMTADDGFVAKMTKLLHPGMIFITTDVPLSADKRSGKDFVIATVS